VNISALRRLLNVECSVARNNVNKVPHDLSFVV